MAESMDPNAALEPVEAICEAALWLNHYHREGRAKPRHWEALVVAVRRVSELPEFNG